MICKRCKREIQDNWKLCLYCGAALDANEDYEGVDFLALASQIEEEDKATDKAEAPFKTAAANGNAKDKYALAYRYRVGKGVKRNSDKYKKWLQLSAEGGYAPAQNELGEELSFVGDNQKAYQWFQAAAKQNFTRAQTHLAFCYYDGKGVKRNHVEAAKWFEKAAQNGHSPSIGMIARLYDRGDGVEQNTEKAIFWYEKAMTCAELPYLKQSYTERYNELTSSKNN